MARYIIAGVCTDLVYEIVFFDPGKSTEKTIWLTFVIAKQHESNILVERVIICLFDITGIDIELGSPHSSKQ
jgi:hypothetical protein